MPDFNYIRKEVLRNGCHHWWAEFMITPKVDFYLNNDWLDKTLDVRQTPPIRITGGSKDEAPIASPSRCVFTRRQIGRASCRERV